MKNIYSSIKKNLLSGKKSECGEAQAAASDISEQITAQLTHEMKQIGSKEHECPCSGEGGGGESRLVDFIILVDASGSMDGAWEGIGAAYEKAIEAAAKECDKDVAAVALSVDRNSGGTSSGGISGTIFTKSHEQHLRDLGYTGPFRTEQADAPEEEGYSSEEGAEAIIDLINHHPWRKGACRAIFYVSDEWIDGSGPVGNRRDAQSEIRATKRAPEALAAAMAGNVTLFAHHLGKRGYGNATVAASNKLYHDMVDPTGGFVIDGQDPSEELYTEVLAKAICNSCANAGGCAEVEWPQITPCVHVNWGASDCDKVESHDDEVVSISLCNCYGNVTFENVSLAWAVVTDEKGNLPPLLPDGSPSVHLYPTGPICFGDIGPCVDGEETCVSRQFVLLNRGAVAGNYRLQLGPICFETSQHNKLGDTAFEFEICKD